MTFRTWLNTEVTTEEAEMLKDFLDENDIEYETSEAYDLIHFEINVNEYEKDAINDFIDENF